MDFQKKQILDEQEKSRKLQEFIAEYGKEEGLKKYREWEEEFDEEAERFRKIYVWVAIGVLVYLVLKTIF